MEGARLFRQASTAAWIAASVDSPSSAVTQRSRAWCVGSVVFFVMRPRRITR